MMVMATVLIEEKDGALHQKSREFGTFRSDREALCNWLKEYQIELIVMESTGNYWKSIYAALESAQLRTYVVNAYHVKNVPGRKTDINDSQWLASLARVGLLKPSFIAPMDLQQLRIIGRYRMKMVGMRAMEKNRLHKILDDSGIRLGGVVSDINGKSAEAIIKGLIQGETLSELIQHACGRLKSKRLELMKALDEPLSERHRLLLLEIQQHLNYLTGRIKALDNELILGMESYRISWELLQTIPGVDAISAASLIAEFGEDMGHFGSAEHLASWAGMCPGNNESAGKSKPGRRPKGNRIVRQLLCEIANAAIKTKSQFKGKYRALVIRRGHKRSIIALGHKLLRVIYTVLKNKQPYRDPNIDYEALVVDKNAPRWLAALEKYGYLSTFRNSSD